MLFKAVEMFQHKTIMYLDVVNFLLVFVDVRDFDEHVNRGHDTDDFEEDDGVNSGEKICFNIRGRIEEVTVGTSQFFL